MNLATGPQPGVAAFSFPRRVFVFPSSWMGPGAGLGASLEHVVPVMLRRSQALDSWMERDHGLSHILAGGIVVKAAVDGLALLGEGSQPVWIGSGARGGDAAVLGVKGKAADGIDGRFDQDDGWQSPRRDGEKAQVLLGARGQPAPGDRGGAAQFGTHRLFFFSKEQENGISPVVGIEGAGLDQRLEQGLGKGALPNQVAAD